MGHSDGDKAQRIVIDNLLQNTDIVCIQETFLSKQDLDKLNSVNDYFYGVGESTTDLSLGIVRGRIPRGVVILWHKKYDSLISVLRLEVDWCIVIKVEHNKNVFVMFNVYTPYECCQNEDGYMSRLALLSSIIKESECTCIFIVRDMNADISNENILFGQHLIRFCQDNKLALSSQKLLPIDIESLPEQLIM